MHIPRFMRQVNRVFTNPLLGTFAWLVPPLAIVHHVGRKSGRPYRTPVVAFPSAAGFVIPMTYGRDVDWARNLVAADGCEIVQMGRRTNLCNPRIVGFKVAESHLPAAVRPVLRAADFPGYVLLDTATDKSRRAEKSSSRSKPARNR
ncbi:MAG: nitroreductase family deazaflavin-dependent oxidoreductase [Deltaproteobacteria bacterium]|nr:nitroreductase family deazaflavin-dependent oxidoreductase [Deltaproteobacteria bacterium]MBI3388208.1 nitroreductase family deazaflavin-dependent oxidoreductase [Deltaproteobacteria bacterium]